MGSGNAMRRIQSTFFGLSVVLALASCGALPKTTERPSLGLRYRAVDPVDWTGDRTQWLQTTMAKAPVMVDFLSPQSRLVLTVENPTKEPLQVRVGPQSGAAKGAAIGEVRMQRRGGGRLEGSSGYAPFLPRSLVTVEPECQAVFYIDAPLGHEPRVGEFAVILVEVGPRDAKPERRLLPIVVGSPLRSDLR
jgi:hypothetical protein